MTGAVEEDLPLLTFETACDLGEFPEFALVFDDAEIASYSNLTGTRCDSIMPPGMAAIFGRLGYLRGHRMPGGGVLLGQEITWMAPARLDRPLMIKAVVESAREDDKGRRQIVFVTSARQEGRTVASVRITAGWPA